MRIAVVIVNYRTPELVLQCLESLLAERRSLPGLQAMVVDNASGDHSVDLLAPALALAPYEGWVEFLPLPLNGGFAWGNNQAILRFMGRQDPPEAILLLNPDAMIMPGAIAALASLLETCPAAGAVGAQLQNADGSPSGSAFRYPSIVREFLRGLGLPRVGRMLGIEPILVPYGQAGPVDWVTGACVLLRTKALREAGLFDTGFFLYFEEVELMARLRRTGWRVYHCPESHAVHFEGAATGVRDDAARGRPPPDYMFASRKRYFALTRGRGSALLAGLAWLAGSGLAMLLGALLPSRRNPNLPVERDAMLKNGLRAPASAAVPAIGRIGDPPGQPPHWMSGHG